MAGAADIAPNLMSILRKVGHQPFGQHNKTGQVVSGHQVADLLEQLTNGGQAPAPQPQMAAAAPQMPPAAAPKSKSKSNSKPKRKKGK